MHSVFCFTQVIMSSCRIMCLWMLLIAQSCNVNGDPNFTIARVGSDTLSVLEGDDVTMTCSFTVDYNHLNISRGTVYFIWFENTMSDKVHANNGKPEPDHGKLITYSLGNTRDQFNIGSSGGSARFIERTDTSSSLTIQNVHPVHDGPYVCAIHTAAIINKPFLMASDQITLSIYVEPELKINVNEDWIVENDSVQQSHVQPQGQNQVLQEWLSKSTMLTERKENRIS